MKKAAILMIAGSLKIGGAEKVARDIALYAPRGKYEFHYVVFGDRVGEYEAGLVEQGCRIFHLPEPSDSYGQYIRGLKALMRQHHYHAVHAHTMFNCGWVMWAAKQMGVPVRVAHSHSALSNGSGGVKTVYEWFMRRLILRNATDYVACGEAAGRRLFGDRAYDARGNLILNGIDVPAFRFDPEKREKIRKQYGLGDRFVAGHAGHLAQVKNQKFLLELMPLILEHKPNAVLFLLGEGEDRHMLEERIRTLGLQKHVIMTGNVSNVADYLSAMDVFVFPSLFEGTPLAVLEVQANGLPCVISDRVPKDVFLTDLLHPLSLDDGREAWAAKILSAERHDCARDNKSLRGSRYAVETAMEKIYRIYDKE